MRSNRFYSPLLLGRQCKIKTCSRTRTNFVPFGHVFFSIGSVSKRQDEISSLRQRTGKDHTVRQISFLSKEAATQPADYDPKKRWMAVPPANLVHLSIGGVYVYSMWTPAMTSAIGVVSSAPTDWTHSEVLPVFSAAAVTFGITSATFGSWVEKAGPRMAGTVGSFFWSTGLMTTGLGVYVHSLPLIYLGYGLFGGIGWGLMYLSPVTTVMKWFPDRRGLATGIALSVFGAGAAIAPAIIHSLLETFASAPEYIGPLTSDMMNNTSHDIGQDQQQQFVTLTTLSDGSQAISDDSPMGTPGDAVVVATEGDLAKLSYIDTGPGAYKLGTGDTGVAKSLGALGLGYGVAGLIGSRFMILPHSDWTPESSMTTMDDENKSSKKVETEMQTSDKNNKNDNDNNTTNTNDVGLSESYVVSSTSQFPLLWLTIFGNATGGVALVSSSKHMITDIWAGIAPTIVTTSFATGYVSTLGIGMAVGRFGWSTLSDYLGRKNTYMLFGLGIPVMGLVPTLTHAASVYGGQGDDGQVLQLLHCFYGGSVLAITFYGGLFSTLPAYIADLFGQKHAGAIHGKLLTAWASSAVVGPMGLGYLRNKSEASSIRELLSQIEDTTAFEQVFGCSVSDSETIYKLIEAKTITIPRLLEIVPEGTIDPSPFLYDTTCLAAASLMGVSFLANLAIRPLDYQTILQEMEGKKKEVKGG